MAREQSEPWTRAWRWDRLEQWSARFFRERQLLLRTDGRVHYVFLTARLQKSVAAVLVVGLLVALVAGGRFTYQSYLVHKGRAQIAALRAQNSDLASALKNAAEVRDAERRIAERVRTLQQELDSDVARLTRVLAQSGLDIKDIVPGDLPVVASAGVRPAAGGSVGATSYARDLADLELTMIARSVLWDAVRAAPLARPTDDGRLTSGFGVRRHPITGRRSMHRGVDISSLRRTPIYAPAPGVVTFVGTKGGFGKFSASITHGYTP